LLREGERGGGREGGREGGRGFVEVGRRMGEVGVGMTEGVRRWM